MKSLKSMEAKSQRSIGDGGDGNGRNEMLGSMKKILLEEELLIEDVLLEDDDALSTSPPKRTTSPTTLPLLRKTSPTYTRL